MLKTYIIYLLVGGMNTIFGIFAYITFSQIGFNYAIALAFSTFVGVLFNYFTLSKSVFNVSSKQALIKYCLNYLLVYLLSIAMIYLLIRLGFDQNFSGAMVILVMSLLNFYILQKFVFIN
jgi:putative flippase GtrA